MADLFQQIQYDLVQSPGLPKDDQGRAIPSDKDQDLLELIKKYLESTRGGAGAGIELHPDVINGAPAGRVRIPF